MERMLAAAFVIGGGLLLVVMLTRKKRRPGPRAPGRGSAAGMARAGMLEMQSFLQPDRKIEILAEGEFEDQQETPSADPPEPGQR